MGFSQCLTKPIVTDLFADRFAVSTIYCKEFHESIWCRLEKDFVFLKWPKKEEIWRSQDFLNRSV